MSMNNRTQLPEWIDLSSPLPNRRLDQSHSVFRESEVDTHAHLHQNQNSDDYASRFPMLSDQHQNYLYDESREGLDTGTLSREFSTTYPQISSSVVSRHPYTEQESCLSQNTHALVQESLRQMLMDHATEPAEIRSLFLETSCQGNKSCMRGILQVKDIFGRTALDHAVMMVVQAFFRLQRQPYNGNKSNSFFSTLKDPTQMKVSTLALERMSVIIHLQQQYGITQSASAVDKPLIRLLSLASSGERTSQTASKAYIHRAVKSILSMWPSALYQSANISGCSCLHIALRHFGDDLDLVRYLLEQDSEGRLVRERNYAGDLALHVASSQQVCFDVLKVVAEKTVKDSYLIADKTHSIQKEDLLAGSTNKAGWTPLDLELIKYLEGGECKHASSISDRFTMITGSNRTPSLSSRAQNFIQFYNPRRADRNSPNGSGETSGLSMWQTPGKPVYEMIWQRAIECIKDLPEKASLSYFEQSFLPRAILLINASTFDNINTLESSIPLLSTEDIVHKASRLCSRCKSASISSGSSMSFFLLEYLAWKFPEQLSHCDRQRGKLPLHYAVVLRRGDESCGEASLAFATYPTRRQESLLGVWSDWIKHLLMLSPKATMIRDGNGRLPLHCFIDSLNPQDLVTHDPRSNESMSIDFYDTNKYRLLGAADSTIIQEITSLLVNTYPESLQYLDPVSQLFPFSQMAVHGHLETTYALLRACPSVLANWRQCQQHHSPLALTNEAVQNS